MISPYLIIMSFYRIFISYICLLWVLYRLYISSSCLFLFDTYLFNYDIASLSFVISFFSFKCYDRVELTNLIENDSAYFWIFCMIGIMPDNTFVNCLFLLHFNDELSSYLHSSYGKLFLLLWSALIKLKSADYLCSVYLGIPFLHISL